MRIEIKVPEPSYPVSEKKRKQILRQVNYQFHKLITEAAGNSCLMEPWSNLRLLWTRLSGLMLSLQFPGIIKASLEEHLEIANSFRQRNPAAAEFAMRAHLETGRKIIFDYLDRLEDEPREKTAPESHPGKQAGSGGV